MTSTDGRHPGRNVCLSNVCQWQQQGCPTSFWNFHRSLLLNVKTTANKKILLMQQLNKVLLANLHSYDLNPRPVPVESAPILTLSVYILSLLLEHILSFMEMIFKHPSKKCSMVVEGFITDH